MSSLKQRRGQTGSRRVLALSFLMLIGSVAALRLAPVWPRLWLFDLYERLDPPKRDSSRIVIIDVDGDSVRRIGPWPWPRDRLAEIIERAGAARVIGVDILLLDPSREVSAAAERRLTRAIAGSRVVLAATQADGSGAGELDGAAVAVTPVLQIGSDAQELVPGIGRIAWPLAVFAGPASGTGLAVVLPGRDGVIRRLPGLYAAGVTLLPSFALEVLRVAAGQGAVRVRSAAAGVEQVSIGAMAVPTDGGGAIWPRFSRETPARVVPAGQVLTGGVDPSVFEGRIVLIGASLAGLGDIHFTPLRQTETGTMINAQLIASVMDGDALRRPALADGAEAVLLVLLAVGSVAASGRLSSLMRTVVVGVTVLLLAAGSYAAFVVSGVLLDWTLAATGLVLVNLSLSALRARDDRRASRASEVALAAALSEVESARGVVTQALNGTKLATLGELASVLAHELRQPIAIMSMAAENADASLQEGNMDVPDARLRIDRIISQAQRAESIISHLSIFSRADPGAAGPVALGEAIEGALLLVGPLLTQNGVATAVSCPAGLPMVMGVKVLIEQVIINLCSNAKDALVQGRQSGRAITLSLRAEAGKVALEVADNGPGIPAAAMAQLFEPFFTTKPAGEGTGLGLSVCRRIVESMGGTMVARNLESGGAAFVATFPALGSQSGNLTNL